MENNGMFDGFMPTITDISISKPTASITSNGDLVDVHCVTIKTLEKEHVFSIAPDNLSKVFFLILKVLSS
jgi:hypothetical protein